MCGGLTPSVKLIHSLMITGMSQRQQGEHGFMCSKVQVESISLSLHKRQAGPLDWKSSWKKFTLKNQEFGRNSSGRFFNLFSRHWSDRKTVSIMTVQRSQYPEFWSQKTNLCHFHRTKSSFGNYSSNFVMQDSVTDIYCEACISQTLHEKEIQGVKKEMC